MVILSSIKNFFCDLFGIETKEEKEVRLKEEQSLPQTGEEQKETSDKEKEEKEHQWENVNEQVKFVCQGGKVQCQYCNPPIADLIATSTTVLLQDKPFITTGDKDGKVNFNFTGLCMHPSQQKPFSPPPPCKTVIRLGEWKNYSQTMIDDNNALMVKSTIPCMISGMDLKIIDSGQKAELTQVKPKVKREFRVTKLYWMDENEENNIEMAEKDEKAILFVETEDFKPDQRVTIPQKDTNTGKEYKLRGRLDSFGRTKILWKGGPCPSEEDDYYYEEDSVNNSIEEGKVISEGKPGYYYQEDGTFLGKIGNNENVFITDSSTFGKIKNNEQITESRLIAFTEKYKINNDQLLDRAHWCYGEGGGTMPDQLANSLNNRSKMLGEEQMYAGMTTKSKKDPNNPITSTRQKKIYFEQSIADSKETVNINYKDFKTLFKDYVKANTKEKIENSKEKFKIKEIKKTISSNIKVISGKIKDDLDGAAFWVSGSTGEKYSLDNSKLGTTVTKVSQKSAYGYPATHWFFNFKKANEKKNTIVYMKEIKLEKPSLK